ncbi:MAG: hypothetical protein M1820_006987 [Bogoriella megaspora]|nr:MAG: hypothetical protein M1820_006987 [Bogoriella megaspora]
MEHLVPSGINVPILVLNICDQDYDHGTFTEFPTRQGWDFKIWIEHNTFQDAVDLGEWLRTSGKSADSLPPFLQLWLVFGLLETATGIEINPKDFTRIGESGRPVLTTAGLEGYLQSWDKAEDGTKISDNMRGHRLSELARNLKAAQAVIEALFRIIVYGSGKDSRPLLEVHFCASLVLRSIAVSSERVLGRHPAIFKMGHGRMPLIEQEMAKGGWCPYMAARISTSMFNDTEAFAFALGTVRTQQDHTQCTYSYCAANQVHQSYVAQHASPTCGCDLIEPPLDSIYDILRSKQIPMLMYGPGTPGGSERCLSVMAHDLSSQCCKYIAISHLWADGLGNPSANTIPLCQLERICRGVEDASNFLDSHTFSDRPFGFWLDTLCIPVDPKFSSLRDFSIQMMHEIYKNAAGVLVLDNDLILLPSNASFAEIVTRTVMSGWNTRLWTYQEATLSSALFVLGRETTFYLNDMVNNLASKDIWPDPLAHSLNITAAATLKTFLPQSSTQLTTKSDVGMQDVLMAIGKRITSRRNDETICIATTLGLDPCPLLRVAPADRMIVLLKMFPCVPVNVLFSSGTRMTQKGFRWAPTSFLRPEGLAGLPVPDNVPKS